MIGDSKTEKITVHPPKIRPQINNIGHGNPRYNSMLPYKGNVLVPCGATLRLIDFKSNEIIYNNQIGHSQIFTVQQNSKYIMVVNFQGLITLLSKENLQLVYQIQASGKQIRHAAFSDDYIIVSCELNNIEYKSMLELFRMQKIENKKYDPQVSIVGDYYYPQIVDGKLIVVQHDDPNPKGKARADTVLWKKLPVKHRVVKFDSDFKPAETFDFLIPGDITCTVYNKANPSIFYLHNGRKMTVFNPLTNEIIAHENDKKDKGYPLCLESYKNGVIYCAGPNLLAYLYLDGSVLKRQDLEIKSLGVGGNLSIKAAEEGFYLFNETGLHFYSLKQQKDYSQSTFNITNCGLSFSPDGLHYAVADFTGNVYMFETNAKSMVPQPREVVNVGVAVRSLVWCRSADRIIIGGTDGSLCDWKELLPVAKPFDNLKHSVNILRSENRHIYAGTSDGYIHIYNEKTLEKVYSFLAHEPVKHQNQKQKELFGSIGNYIFKQENYAEIWSLAISPVHKNPYIIVSSSEDQTQKVHSFSEGKEELIHHLKGHELAVTSVDWKVMGGDLGQVYASCSDDKIIRFRNPQKQFEIMFELETSTIKQWHTLTYLSLEPNGQRVAVGTQNGYVFIYDIAKRDLLFGEKVHLGGVEGLDWKKNKIITISSDLCISIMKID